MGLLLLLQGDGTAAMCANSPGIFTLSVHAASNFPARKQQSSLDVPLPDGLQDEQYLAAVAEVCAMLAGGGTSASVASS
jgi:acetoin utilization deacetylase AcuC-like enzyme